MQKIEEYKGADFGVAYKRGRVYTQGREHPVHVEIAYCPELNILHVAWGEFTDTVSECFCPSTVTDPFVDMAEHIVYHLASRGEGPSLSDIL